MNITLSWDLFVIVFFVVILAYSFIIGRDNTLKVILGTYVSMMAADATGNLFEKYFSGSPIFTNILEFAAVNSDEEAIIFVKVFVFVVLVILFAVRGAFDVETTDDRSAIVRMFLSVIYAVMSAGLILSAILVFVSGVPFMGTGQESQQIALWGVYNSSPIIRSIVSNSNFLLSVPALSFLIHSLYSTRHQG